MYPFKFSKSVISSIFTRLCNYHFLIPEHFHHPKKEQSSSFKVQLQSCLLPGVSIAPWPTKPHPNICLLPNSRRSDCSL